MPDWLLERIFPYTQQLKIETLVSSKTILNINTATLKLIAVGVAGGLIGFVVARLYFHSSAPSVLSAPLAQHEKSMEPAKSAEPHESHESHESHEPDHPLSPMEPAKPSAPTISIEQINTTNPFNNKKFDPILDDKEYVIGFMYKIEELKKSLAKPSVIEKKWRTAFPKTRDLLL
jgi:hypothetical protein